MGLVGRLRTRLGIRFRDLARAAAFLAGVAADGDAPRRARAAAVLVLAYALLPVDLLPDPTMVGILDDVLVLEVGEPGVRRLVPAELREERARNLRRWAIALAVAWLLSLAVGLVLVYRWLA
jgi:uncharacterized membrane protein YkvA (DUF1232 family)